MAQVEDSAFNQLERRVVELSRNEGRSAARKAIKAAVASGDPNGRALLASCLRSGRFGFISRPLKARSLVRTLVAQGNPQACQMLGDDYRLGKRGVAKDEAKARELYAIAAAEGLPAAAGWLAWYEWYGIGGEVNKASAYSHARVAVQGDNLNGYRIGALIQAYGEGVPRNMLLAITILREVLSQEPEDVFALRELGRFLCDPLDEFGLDVTRTESSISEGKRLLKEAALLGDEEACLLVRHLAEKDEALAG